MFKDKQLPGDIYTLVYGKYAPRLCVDTIITSEQGVLLVKRDVPPEVDTWHLPGGTVRRDEKLTDAAQRIVVREVGTPIEIIKIIGAMEFFNEKQEIEIEGKKEKVSVHTVSVVLLAKCSDTPKLNDNIGWFRSAPPVAHSVHIPYLIEHGYLKK